MARAMADRSTGRRAAHSVEEPAEPRKARRGAAATGSRSWVGARPPVRRVAPPACHRPPPPPAGRGGGRERRRGPAPRPGRPSPARRRPARAGSRGSAYAAARAASPSIPSTHAPTSTLCATSARAVFRATGQPSFPAALRDLRQARRRAALDDGDAVAGAGHRATSSAATAAWPGVYGEAGGGSVRLAPRRAGARAPAVRTRSPPGPAPLVRAGARRWAGAPLRPSGSGRRAVRRSRRARASTAAGRTRRRRTPRPGRPPAR